MHLRSPRSLPSRPHKLTGGQAKELFLPAVVLFGVMFIFFLFNR